MSFQATPVYQGTTTKTSSGDVTVVNESHVVVNKTSGAATTVALPAARAGRTITVTDGKGDAATNNITVDPTGAGTVNGASTYVINENFASVTFRFNGTEWNTLSGLAKQTSQAILGTSATPGAATQVLSRVFKKTAIADNTATSIITVTVPDGNHAAAIRLTLLGSLGTGTDTFESSRCAVGCVVLARQLGANVVAAAATLTLAQIATVSGGGTLTLAYGVSAVTGAVGATNTFDIQVTLVKTGTITDLQCVVLAEVINAEAGGITIAAAA